MFCPKLSKNFISLFFKVALFGLLGEQVTHDVCHYIVKYFHNSHQSVIILNVCLCICPDGGH